jgi:hypothetical protein
MGKKKLNKDLIKRISKAIKDKEKLHKVKSSKDDVWTTQEVYDFVIDLYKKQDKLFSKAILKVPPAQRWLVRGRVVNMLFQGHFRLTVDALPPEVK